MHPLTPGQPEPVPTATAITVEQLLAVCEDAADFFRRQLLNPSGASPRAYLASRGFPMLADDPKWAVGYAPNQWHALSDHLASLGYSAEVIACAGLTSRTRSGRTVDTFRDRITFTICDPAGHPIGFIGRAGPSAGPMIPKYLNTRTTPIYDKGSALFGSGDLRAGPLANLVLVEGPLDAIAVNLATGPGIAAVATCGTAFTASHAHAIAALGPQEVTMAFDSDAAGSQAMLRTYGHLKNISPLHTARLNSGTDPAQLFVDRGADAVRATIREAKPAADEVVNHHLRSWPRNQVGAEAELCLLREVLRDVRAMPNRDIAREVGRLARLLPFDHETVTRELINGLGAGRPATGSTRPCLSPRPPNEGRGCRREVVS